MFREKQVKQHRRKTKKGVTIVSSFKRKLKEIKKRKDRENTVKTAIGVTLGAATGALVLAKSYKRFKTFAKTAQEVAKDSHTVKNVVDDTLNRVKTYTTSMIPKRTKLIPTENYQKLNATIKTTNKQLNLIKNKELQIQNKWGVDNNKQLYKQQSLLTNNIRKFNKEYTLLDKEYSLISSKLGNDPDLIKVARRIDFTKDIKTNNIVIETGDLTDDVWAKVNKIKANNGTGLYNTLDKELIGSKFQTYINKQKQALTDIDIDINNYKSVVKTNLTKLERQQSRSLKSLNNGNTSYIDKQIEWKKQLNEDNNLIEKLQKNQNSLKNKIKKETDSYYSLKGFPDLQQVDAKYNNLTKKYLSSFNGNVDEATKTLKAMTEDTSWLKLNENAIDKLWTNFKRQLPKSKLTQTDETFAEAFKNSEFIPVEGVFLRKGNNQLEIFPRFNRNVEKDTYIGTPKQDVDSLRLLKAKELNVDVKDLEKADPESYHYFNKLQLALGKRKKDVILGKNNISPSQTNKGRAVIPSKNILNLETGNPVTLQRNIRDLGKQLKKHKNNQKRYDIIKKQIDKEKQKLNKLLIEINNQGKFNKKRDYIFY